MRWIALCMLLLVACTAQGYETIIRADARVAEFISLFPGASYAETRYDESELDAVRDVVMSDCGAVPDEPFVRARFESRAATLVAYATRDGVFCVVPRLNEEALAIREGDPATVPNGTLLTVNGEPVPASLVGQLGPNEAVNSLLLRQAARNLTVDEAELQQALAAAAAEAGGQEALEAELAAQGRSYDAFARDVRDALRIRALLEREGILNVSVDEEEVREAYLNNTGAFLVGEQVRFRQVYVGEEQRLRDALVALRSGESFCDVVREYSEDADSVGRCGEYVVGRGEVAPDIEATLFSLLPNQTTAFESAAGYHIFHVLERRNATVLSYGEASPLIREALRNRYVEGRLGLYLLRLRAEADIVEYR